MTPAPASALLATEGRDPGRLIVHGEVPSIESLGLNPFARAAMSTTALNDDPGWRPPPPRPVATSKPLPLDPGLPGTMARTNPVVGSIAVTAAVNLPPVFGRSAATARSASRWRVGSKVVVIVSPPLYRAFRRSGTVAPMASRR